MPSTVDTIAIRAKLLLGNRSDLETATQNAINDQLRELSMAYRFPELEAVTAHSESPVGVDQEYIDLAGFADTLYVISDITDVTDSSGHRRLDPVDIREIDKLTVQHGIAKQYSRWKDRLYLDASIEDGTTRNYRIRHRNYHPVMSFTPTPGTLSIPPAWDEVVARGAALRVTRDVLRDFDKADEMEKMFTRAMRARVPVRDEETRDQNFGLQVVI